MSIRNEKEAERFQITVFKGEHSGKGSDGEELAWCKKTISETEYRKISDKYDELVEALEDEEITNDEFDNEIEKIIAELQ